GATTTFGSGGYSLQLSPGTYTVTFSGGALGAAVVRTVTVGGANARLTVDAAGAALADASVWVSHLGQDVLQRALAPAEVSAWAGYLVAGGTREAVASAFVNSPEYDRLQTSRWVSQLGLDVLHRSLQPVEVANWTNYLLAGGSRPVAVGVFVS